MRELREFRAHHAGFAECGIRVAAVCRDRVETNQWWSERLELPYPVLSDREGNLGRALGLMRRVPLGTWSIEFLRRSTVLADVNARISAIWTDAKVRGHAKQVLDAGRTLTALPPA